MTPADAARIYLAYGWSFLPIGHPSSGADGKRPVIEEWATYSQRRPTEDEIAHWFSEPRNIAVIAGQVSGNLVILDLDDAATYYSVTKAYPELRRSLTVRTGKGYHIYTYAPEPVRTASFKLNNNRHHIKAEASYCVAPPSQHASGRVYEWVDSDVPPLELDLEHLQLTLQRIGAKGGTHEEAPKNPPGWAAEAILRGFRKGERDDGLTKLAGHLAYYSVPRDELLAILQVVADRSDEAGTDTITLRSLEHKTDSAIRNFTRLHS